MSHTLILFIHLLLRSGKHAQESHTQKSSFLGEISDNGITAGHINISRDAFKCEGEVKYYQSLSLEL